MSDVHALSGAYAVDALDDLERHQFERHLASCGVCRDEVESLRETSAITAYLAAHTPPPALRSSVLAGIQTIRPIPPVVVAAEARLSGVRARRRRFPALVAAAVALIALGGVGSTVWHPWNDTSTSVTGLTAADTQSWTWVLQNGDGATATVMRSKSEGKAVLTTSKLATLPDGKVYELWLQHGYGLEPAGLMLTPNTPVLLQGETSQAQGAAISIENAGGASTPDNAHIVGTINFKA